MTVVWRVVTSLLSLTVIGKVQELYYIVKTQYRQLIFGADRDVYWGSDHVTLVGDVRAGMGHRN
jgi:hypothetical protein